MNNSLSIDLHDNSELISHALLLKYENEVLRCNQREDNIHMTKVVSEKKVLCTIILIAIYAVFNGILLYFHEPWRDEALAWRTAKYCTFLDIPARVALEGHPCLWHWILYPFAHAGLPYITLNLVSYAVMLAATAFMVWKAPFPIWVKAMFALSPCLTYFYPVIARSYCLIPPILFALAYYYPSRLTHPCRYTLFIALLVQTHVIMEMMALTLGLLLFIEYVRDVNATRNYRQAVHYAVALMIPLVSALFLLYTLRDVRSASAYNSVFHGQFFPCILKMAVFAGAGIMLIVMATIKRTITAYTVVLVTTASICFQIWIYIAVYSPSLFQRYIAATLIVIWAFWIIQDKQNDRSEKRVCKYAPQANRLCNIVLALNLMILIVALRSHITRDLTEPYSNSKDAAGFIKANISEGSIFLIDKQSEVSAIYPYFDNAEYIFRPAMEKVYGVNEEAGISYKEFKSSLDSYQNAEVPVYLISVIGMTHVRDNRVSEDYELIYKSEINTLCHEDYEIYKIH